MKDFNKGYFSRKRKYKDVLRNVTVMWLSKVILITVIIYVANTAAKANIMKTHNSFCSWVADAAFAVAGIEVTEGHRASHDY